MISNLVVRRAANTASVTLLRVSVPEGKHAASAQCSGSHSTLRSDSADQLTILKSRLWDRVREVR